MDQIKNMVAEAKESGNYDMLKGITDNPAGLVDESEELKLKALAVSAIAEADGHAPEAKKILDQVGSDKRKKLKTDLVRPPSSQSNGR